MAVARAEQYRQASSHFTVGSAVCSVDFGNYIQQFAAPGSMLSQMEGLPAFFTRPANNDYPLKVGTVIFTEQTRTEVKEPTTRFEVVRYENGVIEGKSLYDTLQEMINQVEKVITDFQPLLLTTPRPNFQ